MIQHKTPTSPREEIAGTVYFSRLCSKARLHASGELHPDFHPNLGKAMDLWTCQFLHVDYEDLKKVILGGASDLQALEWCWKNGVQPNEHELKWWNSFMRNVGFRDELSEKLLFRKQEAGWQDREDIQTFFDYLDADDGRM
jgi:gluconokinase